MGFSNPPIPWSALERRLSPRPQAKNAAPDDGPGSRKRKPYRPKEEVLLPDGPVVPYAELHCHSNFSFLDGASGPDKLVEQAVRLGLHALAITDHDGFAGAPLFAEIAQKYAQKYPGRAPRTVFGAELSLGLSKPQNGVPDPEGAHLLVLAEGVEGYHRLAAAITDAQLRGDEKGRPVYHLEELSERGRGHWLVLTGCRKGSVRSALARGGLEAAARELDLLTESFGLDHVVVELVDHGYPTDHETNDALAHLARVHSLPVVATNNVHHATPDEHRLAAAAQGHGQ